MAILTKEAEQVASTVVGESILISGKLEGDEDLTVRGRVQGSITLTRTLIVEPSGVVKADSTVRNAVISGVVVGNVTASESVHLTREGRMVGDINSPRVIIVEGAAFRGRIDMGQAAEPRIDRTGRAFVPAPARTMAPAPAVRTVPRPPPPPLPRVQPRPVPRPPEAAAKPPPPPPPPAPARQAPRPEEAGAAAPLPMSLAKRKVVVKRKK